MLELHNSLFAKYSKKITIPKTEDKSKMVGDEEVESKAADDLAYFQKNQDKFKSDIATPQQMQEMLEPNEPNINQDLNELDQKTKSEKIKIVDQYDFGLSDKTQFEKKQFKTFDFDEFDSKGDFGNDFKFSHAMPRGMKDIFDFVDERVPLFNDVYKDPYYYDSRIYDKQTGKPKTTNQMISDELGKGSIFAKKFMAGAARGGFGKLTKEDFEGEEFEDEEFGDIDENSDMEGSEEEEELNKDAPPATTGFGHVKKSDLEVEMNPNAIAFVQEAKANARSKSNTIKVEPAFKPTPMPNQAAAIPPAKAEEKAEKKANIKQAQPDPEEKAKVEEDAIVEPSELLNIYKNNYKNNKEGGVKFLTTNLKINIDSFIENGLFNQDHLTELADLLNDFKRQYARELRANNVVNAKGVIKAMNVLYPKLGIPKRQQYGNKMILDSIPAMEIVLSYAQDKISKKGAARAEPDDEDDEDKPNLNTEMQKLAYLQNLYDLENKINASLEKDRNNVDLQRRLAEVRNSLQAATEAK